MYWKLLHAAWKSPTGLPVLYNTSFNLFGEPLAGTGSAAGWFDLLVMTPPPPIQFGIETEIGIARDNDEHLDVVAESMALVRSVIEPGVLMRWDYDSEDPHADMRGFRVRGTAAGHR